MLKQGDIVVCVNVDPPSHAPKNTKARRHLKLGEIYEVQHDETSVFHGVKVVTKVEVKVS